MCGWACVCVWVCVSRKRASLVLQTWPLQIYVSHAVTKYHLHHVVTTQQGPTTSINNMAAHNLHHTVMKDSPDTSSAFPGMCHLELCSHHPPPVPVEASQGDGAMQPAARPFAYSAYQLSGPAGHPAWLPTIRMKSSDHSLLCRSPPFLT